ncbi:Histone transcription regulator 3 [Podospora pseudocomata]|uniref:Histone transcription regulator 3 homolog n=1 Tax=Podospora pseudocomata TaxID=2093779 RepID=A0ABR0G8B1_9PEZI|nr:Histone transcription regulator 3 [Podospora pseudocomata]
MEKPHRTNANRFAAQPAFQAINVEPDEIVDEEIDNTRDIQVEDALKLFQTALKLHSQGPKFFDDAADAYNALFSSEIFKYPEAKTEYERAEAGEDGVLAVEPTFATVLDAAAAETDTLSNTLPQAFYLAYKNHGQFIVDRIRRKIRKAFVAKSAALEDPAVLEDARKALEDFSAALDRDPSDAELWRKTARIAAFLKSSRISRYSLEAAIELDDDPAVDEVEPPSLAEGYAGEDLKDQLQVLGDEMALGHPIMKPFVERGLPPMLKRYQDAIPFLPNPAKSLAVPKKQTTDVPPPRHVISAASSSWTELGAAMARFVEEEGLSGQAVFLETPDAADDEDIQMEIDMQLLPPDSSPPPDRSSECAVKDEQASGEQSEKPQAAEEESTPMVAEPASLGEATGKERALPSRKRSQSVAGLPDPPEEEAAEGKRSKRTRRRETGRRETAAEEIVDPARLLATQLQPLQAADQNLFQTTKNLLENLGVTDHVTLERIAEVLDSCASDDRMGKIQNLSTVDLRDSILQFDEENATVLLSKRERPQLSLSAFLEHTKSGSQRANEAPAFDETRGVRAFVEKINNGWYPVQDVVFEFFKIIMPTYTGTKWPDHTKTTLSDVITQFGSSIYERVTYELDLCLAKGDHEAHLELVKLVHMVFELYLDVYERTTNPNSTAEESTKVEIQLRVDKWMDLTTEVTRQRNPNTDDELSSRFLWAGVYATTLAKDTPRDHILNCWHSMYDHLLESSISEITLPNNAVMPEISTAAAEREISKLTTMDFFLGLFQEDMGDPTSVIDSLEPVLNPENVYITVPGTSEPNGTDGDHSWAKQQKLPLLECASQSLTDLWKFLKRSSTELRLLLWSRLGEAYGKISYATKQFSCFLRSIETIITDFEHADYLETPPEPRRALFMTMIKALDDLIIQSLHLALNDNSAFDIIDEEHLKSTLSALAKLSCLLHVAAMYEDETRIGMRPAPANNSTLRSFLNKLQEMQVRTWSLQYTMLKVGIQQHPDAFPNYENDLAEYLAAVHQVLGLRKSCKSSNKIFLKMMRVELLKQRNIENWEDYLGQVLYDLHGLKLGVGIWEVQEHGCEPENLEKRQALQLVEKITVLANRMSMKDLLKSDLKTTIERMQQAIGTTKSNPQMTHNLRNYTEYLKTPIHPLHLFQALDGSIDLDAVTINTVDSAPAKHGWYFLLGMIGLTKFKGVELARRQTPGATDDLRIGATYLRLQLQFTPDRWDAWFRLAECFDYELDESVLWSADKMNKDRAELVKFQRSSIHCYTLALSHSYAWSADPHAYGASEDEKEALNDMYREFGMRMYASSREPFAMEPFKHSDQERWFIEPEGIETFRRIRHNEMTDYQVWKFAAHLFRKAMEGKPKEWKNPYMVAKCLWKMYTKAPEELDENTRRHRPTVKMILKALEKTVEVVSALPKPRSGQDPILEPHYKIVSVVDKLVRRGDLPRQEAADLLQRQPYAIDRGKPVTVDTPEEWEAYIIRCLRYLRDKDKSNWQHRIIMRHARVLFPDSVDENDPANVDAAKAAFAVLRENMFTKTMVMNVWKCEAERSGRHYVYTWRYIKYVAKILAALNDRTNLEAVLRRIRKRGADFYYFNELWQYCVQIYLKLIRQTFDVPSAGEDAFKTLNTEEFDVVGEKITEWATTPAAESHPALNAMKEAVELKKLNSNLMKAGPIDDLITDCYSTIYLDVRPELPRPAEHSTETQPGEDSSQQPPPSASQDGVGVGVPAAELKSKLLQNLVAQEEKTVLGSLRAVSEQPDRSEKASVAGDAAPRSHRLGVRRPNILRKADDAVQAVLRVAEAPKWAVSGASRGRGKNGRTPRESEDEEGEEGGEEEGEDVEMKGSGAAAGGHSRKASKASKASNNAGGVVGVGSERSTPGPGGWNDDDDDESDLSDVPPDYEDDIPESLLFPSLGKVAKVESEGEDEEEGEEEEGETVMEGEETVMEEGDQTAELGDDNMEEDEEGEEEEDEGEETHAEDGPDEEMVDTEMEDVGPRSDHEDEVVDEVEEGEQADDEDDEDEEDGEEEEDEDDDEDEAEEAEEEEEEDGHERPVEMAEAGDGEDDEEATEDEGPEQDVE